MMFSITCMCEHVFDFDFPESVNLDSDPASRQAILDGEFQGVTCPSCGKKLKPELPVTLLKPSRGLSIAFIPESERMTFMTGKYAIPRGAECVIGYPELVDRIRILDSDLDREAVEVIRYIYQSKAEESSNGADVDIEFRGMEGNALVFHVHGLNGGQVGVIKPGKDLYEKVRLDIQKRKNEEPFRTILEPPYISVKKLMYSSKDDDQDGQGS